jgi:hypothetical protein
MVESTNLERIELSVSDQSQLRSLQSFLELTVPGLRVTRVAGQPAAGEQGALDIITILASSSGLVAAIKVLPEFLKSRRTGLSIKTTVKGQPFTLEATNLDQVMPVLEKLLDA